jgi:hypothetical protein
MPVTACSVIGIVLCGALSATCGTVSPRDGGISPAAKLASAAGSASAVVRRRRVRCCIELRIYLSGNILFLSRWQLIFESNYLS